MIYAEVWAKEKDRKWWIDIDSPSSCHSYIFWILLRCEQLMWHYAANVSYCMFFGGRLLYGQDLPGTKGGQHHCNCKCDSPAEYNRGGLIALAADLNLV